MSRSAFLPLLAALLIHAVPTAPPAASQTTGVVTSDGDPVAGAVVFVAGTTLSTESADDGSFALPAADLAWYDIAAWSADFGFGVIRHRSDETGDGLSISLNPPESAGAEDDSDDDVGYFRDMAFAWTSNSGDMEIVNPEVLRIERASDSPAVSASATQPLHLINPEIGYEIEMYNFSFEGSPFEATWRGYPRFVEMEPGGRRERRRFTRGRERVYEGSPRHFLRSLAQERLKDEDFEAFHVRGPGDQSELNPVAEMEESGLGMGNIDPIFREGTRPGTHDLMFQGWLRVVFNGGSVENRFIRFVERYYPPSDLTDIIIRSSQPQQQREDLAGLDRNQQANQPRGPNQPVTVAESWIMLPFGSVPVDPMGVILPDETQGDIRALGYWSFLRLADLLPYDYLPED